MTDNIEVGRLLDLYFEGNTTIEQERLLADYFASPQSDPQFDYAKPMFDYFAATAAQEHQFEIRLPFEQPEHKVNLWHRYRKPIVWALSAAAAVAVALTTVLSIEYSRNNTVYCYLNGHPVTDPQLACEQAEMALSLLHSSLGAQKQAGKTALLQLNAHIDRIDDGQGDE